MIIVLSNGRQLRGDLIKSAVFRSDLSPVPATFEATIRVDDELKRLLKVDGIIQAIGDKFRIIDSVIEEGTETQGSHGITYATVIAVLDSCHKISFVTSKPIIKVNATLAEIYKASGATIKAIDADFAIPRFTCLVGDAPSYHIAEILQEEGGCVRWKSGKLSFIRLQDLNKQNVVLTIPDISSENVESGFTERHQVPWFYSTDDSGGFVYGNQDKARSTKFIPKKNTLRLHNMTRVLIRKKVSKTALADRIVAGDLVGIQGSTPLVVVTAAHVFNSGTDGSPSKQYTKLWLSSVE